MIAGAAVVAAAVASFPPGCSQAVCAAQVDVQEARYAEPLTSEACSAVAERSPFGRLAFFVWVLVFASSPIERS